MPTAHDIHSIVFKNSSAIFLARVVGNDGLPIQQSDLSSISYSIYSLDERNIDNQTVVTGHDNVSVDKTELIFDTLQTDPLWNQDNTGYNFKYAIDISTHQAFSIAGKFYQIRFSLTPTTGQPIIVRFQVKAI